uniref:SprT-like domain-containing protein n=1 Tax=Syphacia muris TaxID=451379 RepID=A0A0N5AJF9_9BILA
MSATYIVNGVLIRERKNCYHSDEKKSLHNEEPEKSSLVDPALETLDPTPDIHSLFLLYNDMFFGGVLGGCEVKWSPRMTSCAGVCSYEGRGGLCSIRLSKPLLIFRPRRDLVETLLHEMIHAYLFVTVRDRDRDGHGARFQYHMRRINEMAGTHITIYHKFFAEVANYKQHWWRCDGPCQSRRPYFGWVKRATNRAPGPNDFWWKQHQQCCGGKFIKVKEPDGYTGSKKTKSTNPNAGNNSISKKKDLLTRTSNPASSSSNSFSGKGYILGSSKGTENHVVVFFF